jgi:hypothetical protein
MKLHMRDFIYYEHVMSLNTIEWEAISSYWNCNPVEWSDRL